MLEKDKEKLVGGQIIGEAFPLTTDEPIERQIELLRHEISGLPSPTVVVDSPDRTVSVNTTGLIEDSTRQIRGPSIVQGEGSPIQIFELRQQKKVAFGLGDSEFAKQLKNVA